MMPSNYSSFPCRGDGYDNGRGGHYSGREITRIEYCSSMTRTKNLISLKWSSKKPRVFILLCPLITELLHRICAMHGNCLRLAQLHSEAVRVSEYPDFMDKADNDLMSLKRFLENCTDRGWL